MQEMWAHLSGTQAALHSMLYRMRINVCHFLQPRGLKAMLSYHPNMGSLRVPSGAAVQELLMEVIQQNTEAIYYTITCWARARQGKP